MDIRSLKKQLITFLIIEFILTVILYSFRYAGVIEDRNLLILILMWSPTISAFSTSLFYQKNLRGFGWGWGKTRYQAQSYFLPFSLALIVYGIVWLSGLGGVSTEPFITFVSNFIGSEETLTFPVAILIFSALGLLGSAVNGAGEEFGWRGFFVPRLFLITTYTKTCLISGAVWSVWHYPAFFLADYTSGLPFYYTIPCFTILVFGGSFIFNWITLKSGSVWTAVILHSAHNLFIQGLFDKITINNGTTLFFTSEFGIGMAIIYSAAAYYFFWSRRDELIVSQEYFKGTSNNASF